MRSAPNDFMRRFVIMFCAATAPLLALDGASSAVTEALRHANALFDAHQYNEAKAAFAKVLTLDPDNVDANWRLGLYACDAGDWEKALALEDRALRHDPNDARLQYGWGAANGVAALKSGLFSKLGYAHKCLAAYRRAAELEPKNAQYRYALFSFYQQAPGFAGGDRDLARDEANALRTLDPGLARQAWALIDIMDKNVDAAFHEYDVFLRDHPDDYLTLYSCGMIAIIAGQRIDDSLAALRHCLRLQTPAGLPSHADVHCKIAALYEKKGDRRTARIEYLAALKEDANFWQAKHGLEQLGRE